MADQVETRLQGDCKKKGVKFSFLNELVLNHGRPMIDYERSKSLLKFPRMKNMLSKHWSKSTHWEISGHLHLVVLRPFREVVQSARIISTSPNEITSIDHTSWLEVHVYIMENCEKIPYLLCLLHITKSGKLEHLTN